MIHKPTIEELKLEFKRLGYKWFPFMGIAIRSKENKPNKFDDLIGFIANDTITWCTGTTDPGTYHLNNPGRIEGTAKLVPGQYIDTWTIGKHQDKYDAWKQSKPVKVYRDNDKDSVSEDSNLIQEGLFGINWHRANEKAISQNVDKWSAGCMVMNNFEEFDTFLKASSESGLGIFTGVLLNEF